ncbi:ornithine carbamoyltransferase, partial [Ornithinicoccus halotolerans]|uniref:ornithine carbamoyltransferase n=1 Tax=Ornithinicoccus halotolerans TaxID=1748220 RepID=UPI001297DD66
MAVDLRGRSLLSLQEYTAEEIMHLLDLAAELKAARRQGREQPRLTGRTVALVFEKTSTRTRSAFEVAAAHQGARTTFLDPGATQIGHKESIKDTARVLGRMYDAIQFRGSAQSAVELLAEHAGVPVYNGLTDDWHPTQMLADLLTMREHSDRPLQQVAYAYVGDARNNMGNSLLLVGAKLGMDVRIGAPAALQPEEWLVSRCREIAATTGARVTVTEDPKEAVAGVDFVH